MFHWPTRQLRRDHFRIRYTIQRRGLIHPPEFPSPDCVTEQCRMRICEKSESSLQDSEGASKRSKNLHIRLKSR